MPPAHQPAQPVLKRPASEKEIARARGMQILFDKRVYGEKMDSFEKAFKVINGYRTARDLWGRTAYALSLPRTKRSYAIIESNTALRPLASSEDDALRKAALQSLRELHGDIEAEMTLYAKIREYDALGSPHDISEKIKAEASGSLSKADLGKLLQKTMKLINLEMAFGDLCLLVDVNDGRTSDITRVSSDQRYARFEYAFEGSENYYLSARVYCMQLLQASDSALAKAGLNRAQINTLVEQLTEKLGMLGKQRTPARVMPVEC